MRPTGQTRGGTLIGQRTYDVWRVYVTNPLNYTITAYFELNGTMTAECAGCTLQGGRLVFELSPAETVELTAYMRPQEELTQSTIGQLITSFENPFIAFIGVVVVIAMVALAHGREIRL